MTDERKRSAEVRSQEGPDAELARWRAAQRDAACAETFDLSQLWNALCTGSWRVFDAFSSDERCYALLEQPADNRRQRVQGVRLSMFESVLLGQSPKVVSIDLRVSPSTVAAAIRSCLRTMGLRYRVSNLPVLLVMAARAARSSRSTSVSGRIARLEHDGGARWVVSIERPDLTFPAQLSSAELAVVRQLVQGSSHAQISRVRGTSTRTVANQLSTAFRKLGVSGRGELVDQLLLHTMSSQALSRRSVQALSA
jgi:DNA-binding CsgD family transcriptional regulator